MSRGQYNPEWSTRKNLRLSSRDYASAGAYFVTIRALLFEPAFFTIPALRHILQEAWEALPERFSHINLDEFVIMPDHIHFILWLHRTEEKQVPLGSIVGAYKSLTTVTWIKHLKSIGRDMEYPCRIWQSNYYERVIRMNALEQIRQYIRDNPSKLRT